MRPSQVFTLFCVLQAAKLIGCNEVKRNERWKGSIGPQESFTPLKLFEVYIGNRSAFSPLINALDFVRSLNDSNSGSSVQSEWTPSQRPALTEFDLLETASKRQISTKPSLVTLLKPPAFQPIPKPEDLNTLPSISDQLITGNSYASEVSEGGSVDIGKLHFEDQDELVMTLYPHPSSVKRIPVMPGDTRSRIPPQVLSNVNSSVSVVHSMQVFAPKQGYFPSMAAKYLETADENELSTPKPPDAESNRPSEFQLELNPQAIQEFNSDLLQVYQHDSNPPPLQQYDVSPLPIHQPQRIKLNLIPFTAEDVIYGHNFKHVVSTTTEAYEDHVAQGSEQRITQETEFKPMKISNAHQGPVPAFWADMLEKMNQTLDKGDIMSIDYTMEDLVVANEDFTVEVHGALALPLQSLENATGGDSVEFSSEDETVLSYSTTEVHSLEKDSLEQLGENDSETLKAESLEDQRKLEEFMLIKNEDWKSELKVFGLATGGEKLAEQKDANFTLEVGTSHDKNFDNLVASNFTPESTVSREIKKQIFESKDELLTKERFTTELLPTTFVGTTDFLLTTVEPRECITTTLPAPISKSFSAEFSSPHQDVHVIVADLGNSVKPKSKRLKDAVIKSNKMSPKGAVFTVVEGHSKVRFFGYNPLYEDPQAQYHVNKDNSIYVFPTKDTVQTLHQQQSDQITGIRPVYFAKRPLTSLSGPYEYDQHLKRLSSNRLPPSTSSVEPNRTSQNVSTTYQRIKQIRPFFNTKYVRSRIPWRNK